MKKRTTLVPNKQTARAMFSDLTETEQDLLRHLQGGYQLETDSLGRDPRLRGGKDREVIRPLSATQNTVKVLQDRGLIAPAKSPDPLRIVWQLQKAKQKKKART